MEREYLFGVLSVVWQEALHGGNEAEIIERGINAILHEAAQQSVQSDECHHKFAQATDSLGIAIFGVQECAACGIRR